MKGNRFNSFNSITIYGEIIGESINFTPISTEPDASNVLWVNASDSNNLYFNSSAVDSTVSLGNFTFTGSTMTTSDLQMLFNATNVEFSNTISDNNTINMTIGDTDNTQIDTIIGASNNVILDGINTNANAVHDRMDSGFIDFGNESATIWTIAGDKFTLNVSGSGRINGKLIEWQNNQTTTAMAQYTEYYVSISPSGNIVLGSGAGAHGAMHTENINLFYIYRGLTDYMVQDELHTYRNSNMSLVYFNSVLIGPAVSGTNDFSTIGSTNGSDVDDRRFQIVSDGILHDSGLLTAISPSLGAVNFQLYIMGSSGVYRYAQTTNVPMAYESSNSPTSISINSHAIFTVCLAKSDVNNEGAQVLLLMNSKQYGNINQARAAIEDSTPYQASSFWPNGEIGRLGYLIVKNTSNGGYIRECVLNKSSVGNNNIVSGGGITQSSLIQTDTTNFNGFLSATETTSQMVFDKIDEIFDDDVIITGGGLQIASAGEIIKIPPNNKSLGDSDQWQLLGWNGSATGSGIDGEISTILTLDATASSANVRLSSLGTGELFAVSSSERYKINITDFNENLGEHLLNFQPKSFDLASLKELNAVGFIAENLYELSARFIDFILLPKSVVISSGWENYVISEDENGCLLVNGINWNNITLGLVQLCKTQQSDIQTLESNFILLQSEFVLLQESLG